MAHQDSFILCTLKSGIQKVVLNRPEKKNALSLSMYKKLTMLLNETAKDDKVLIFLLTANGDFFSSGNDITGNVTMEEDSLTSINSAVKELIDAVITYPKLLIAVVNGPAIGIACTMLGLFDMVYASDKAYFRTPFTSLGLVAEGCSTYMFPRLLGHSKAGDMLYFGYKMSALEAKQYGLVSEVYKHDSLEKVWDYLSIVSKLSSESILAIKHLMSRWNKEILLEVNAEEIRELKKRFESPDLAERIFNTFIRNKL